VVADAGTAAYPEASTLGKVLVLAPQLTVERMEDGTPTQLPNKAEFVRTDLARLALESLTSHGIAAASADAAGGAMAMGQAAEVETRSRIPPAHEGTQAGTPDRGAAPTWGEHRIEARC
jgi:hypothetical protein